MNNVINLSTNSIDYINKTNYISYVVPDDARYFLDPRKKISGRERFYVTDEASINTVLHHGVVPSKNIIFEYGKPEDKKFYGRCLDAKYLPLPCCRFIFEIVTKRSFNLHDLTPEQMLKTGMRRPLTATTMFDRIEYPENFEELSYNEQKQYYNNIIEKRFSYEAQIKSYFERSWRQRYSSSSKFAWENNPSIIVYELKRLPISSVLSENDIPLTFEEIAETYDTQLYLWDMTDNTVVSGLNGCNAKFYDDNYKNYEKQFRFVTIEGIKIYDYNKYDIEWLLFNDKPEI